MAKRNTSGSSSGRRGSSRNRKEDSSSSRGNSGKPFKKSSGPSRSRSRDDEGSSGEKRSFGKKPYSSRPKRDDQRGDSRPERRSSSGKSGFAGKRSDDRGYSSRGDSDSKFPKRSNRGGSSFGSKRRSDEEGSSSSRGGERSGFRKTSSSFGGKRRSSDDQKFSSGGDRNFRKDSRGGGFKKRSDDSSERKPFRKKSFGDSNEDRGERPSRGIRKSDGSSSGGDSGFRKDSRGGGFKRRSSSDEGSSEKKPFRKKSFGDSDSKEERSERPTRGLKRSDEFSSGKKSSDDSGQERTERPVRALRKSDDESTGSSKKSRARSERSPQGAQPDLDAPVQTGQIRLNKYIANSGVCSRREADELIKMGLVSVNGKTVSEMGYKVNPGDEVRYENKVLTAEKPVYILMNKPKGYLTTTDDPQERNTVMHIIGGVVKERIYPVGRLDRNTTGLLLLTNDGDLAEKLMHPSYNIKKIYKVDLDRPLTKADFEKVREGVVLEEGRAAVDDIAIVSEDGKTVGIEIHIGWNRVIRRIFEALGYEVVRLDRSVYAGLDKKELSRGQWRFLKKEEIIRLKHLQ
jgi:23S rRNA pseudouridine2605 synthase